MKSGMDLYTQEVHFGEKYIATLFAAVGDGVERLHGELDGVELAIADQCLR